MQTLTTQQKWEATRWLLTDVLSLAGYMVLALAVVFALTGDQVAVLAGIVGGIVVVAVLAHRFLDHWVSLAS